MYNCLFLPFWLPDERHQELSIVLRCCQKVLWYVTDRRSKLVIRKGLAIKLTCLQLTWTLNLYTTLAVKAVFTLKRHMNTLLTTVALSFSLSLCSSCTSWCWHASTSSWCRYNLASSSIALPSLSLYTKASLYSLIAFSGSRWVLQCSAIWEHMLQVGVDKQQNQWSCIQIPLTSYIGLICDPTRANEALWGRY